MATLPFLLLALSLFVIFDSDYAWISCLLCKSNNLWYIFMVLGRNVEQEETMCQVQELQLRLSYFKLELSPPLVFEFDFVSVV